MDLRVISLQLPFVNVIEYENIRYFSDISSDEKEGGGESKNQKEDVREIIGFSLFEFPWGSPKISN